MPPGMADIFNDPETAVRDDGRSIGLNNERLPECITTVRRFHGM